MAVQTRREREKAEHRQQILEAAEAVFAEKDFHSATVQEIAARAEFSVGSIYNLFESKEGIFSELLYVRASEYATELEEHLAGAQDALAKLRTVIRAKLDYFQRRRRFFRIFCRLAALNRLEGPVLVPIKCRERYHQLLRRIADIFVEGMRDGIFVRADPFRLVLCVEGMTNAAIGYWVHSGGGDADPIEPDLIERVLLRGILVEKEE